MAVWERQSKGGTTFYLNVKVDPHHVRMSLKGAAQTRPEAEQFERWLRVQLEAGRHPEDLDVLNRRIIEAPARKAVGPQITLRQALDRALAGEWADHKTRDSFFGSTAALLCDHFGPDTPLIDVDEDAIWGFVRRARTQGFRKYGEGVPERKKATRPLSGATINLYLSVLGRVLYLAGTSWKGPDRKPLLPEVRTVRPFRQRQKEGNTRYLSVREEEQALGLLASSGREHASDYRDYFVVLLDTGVRLSEGLRLRPMDYDGENRRLLVTDSKGKDRVVPTSKRVDAILQRRCQGRDRDAPFWDHFNIDRVEDEWNHLRADMGLTDDGEFTTHCLRHTCLTRLSHAGVDTRAIQAWAGHADIKTTVRYTHIAGKQLLDIRDRLEAATQ